MRQSSTQACNSKKDTKRKRKRGKENAEEKGKARLDARNFSLGQLREVGDDDAVIQFGFKIANSVSQHVKASRCLDRGSTASSYLQPYKYNAWIASGAEGEGRLRSNWASACKQSLRGLRLRDASFSLICRDARRLSRPF